MAQTADKARTKFTLDEKDVPGTGQPIGPADLSEPFLAGRLQDYEYPPKRSEALRGVPQVNV